MELETGDRGYSERKIRKEAMKTKTMVAMATSALTSETTRGDQQQLTLRSARYAVFKYIYAPVAFPHLFSLQAHVDRNEVVVLYNGEPT